MTKYFNAIKSTGLFKDFETGDIESMLNCLSAEKKQVYKDEIVLLTGEKPQHVGIVLSGQLHILKEDRDGNRTLIAALASGDMYAEALCCAGVEESPVTVMAGADSTVMLLTFSRLTKTCSRSCPFHIRLIENMLGIIANKNLMLQNRMEIISLKSLRPKIMRYFEPFISVQGNDITIPFNREELADFLCVERSALSHELARMKKDGLIDYRKNRFTLK